MLLVDDTECICLDNLVSDITLVGDMNGLETAYLFTTCGLADLSKLAVIDASHGSNTLDKFLTSRLDLFAYRTV